MMDQASKKKSKKELRSSRVLLGLIELFIKTGRPVGSQTLQEAGFDDLSSATIRNYFAGLEEEGYLTQSHSSGGRMPTEKAFRLYAEEMEKESPLLDHLTLGEPVKEIASWLDLIAENLSAKTQTAVVISAPRFDHDFIRTVRLIALDKERLLAVLITDFGLVKTEIVPHHELLDEEALTRLERYFLARLHGQPIAHLGSVEEIGSHLYHEIMVRYLASYSHFAHPDLHKKGFSTLLSYPECSDPLALAQILGLFEYEEGLHALLNQTLKKGALNFWVGQDLNLFCPGCETAGFIACPYALHQRFVGAIGLLGPLRMDYKTFFSILKTTAKEIGESLTKSLYTFKLSFREPNIKNLYLTESENKLLIENQP